MTVFFGNLLAHNPTVPAAMATVAATDADVLVLTEFTPVMHDALVVECGDRYPHRIEAVLSNPAGIAIWSRVPLTGAMAPLSDRPSVDALVHVHGTSVRLIGVHTEPPTMRAREWSRELRDIGDLAEPGTGDGVGADLVLGDFNAARWHPSFRRLLRRGWTTAHEWLGHWSSNSWANEGRAFPLFVRIDHALLRGDRLQPVRLVEVPLPGSDHRGFVLTVTVRP
jgi:endonuclease/exonuclease/phosphatase (EEP) superfamily protein YafD